MRIKKVATFVAEGDCVLLYAEARVDVTRL